MRPFLNQTIPITQPVGTLSPAVPSATSAGVRIAQQATLRFEPRSHRNVVVYYGQSPGTSSAGTNGLVNLCKSPDIDVINLAFVNQFFGPNGFPSASFGPACVGQTSAQAQQAPGLEDCTALGRQILTCQEQYGKVIMVSLGGYGGSSYFTSAAQAKQFASTLWSLFGNGNQHNSLRPFGQGVVVDGFDIDNESNQPQYYDSFAAALLQLYAQDPARRYYLSAAPQCPFPDASIPQSALKMCDWVGVQFYNNSPCNLNSGAGFINSVTTWSRALGTGSRLLIGAPAWPGGGSGYVDPGTLAGLVMQVRRLRLGNIGGIFLWDGTEALANVDAAGENYIEAAAAAVDRRI